MSGEQTFPELDAKLDRAALDGILLATARPVVPKALLREIGSFQLRGARCFCTVQRFANLLQVSTRTVDRALKILADLDLVISSTETWHDSTGFRNRTFRSINVTELHRVFRAQQTPDASKHRATNTTHRSTTKVPPIRHIDPDNTTHRFKPVDQRVVPLPDLLEKTPTQENVCRDVESISAEDWNLITSELIAFGVAKAQHAIAIGVSCGLSIADARERIAAAKVERKPPGWLFNWFCNPSSFRPKEPPPSANNTAQKRESEWFSIEYRITRAGRNANAPEAVIQARLIEARAQFDAMHRNNSDRPNSSAVDSIPVAADAISA